MRANCVARTYRYNPLTPLHSLRRAITKSKPNLIIPTDDLITAHVHKLFHLSNAEDFAGDRLRSLIAQSLGRWENYPTFYVRSEIARFAQTAGDLRRLSEKSPTTAICLINSGYLATRPF